MARPLPSADIAEHRASYTWALQGLCPQSRVGERETGRGSVSSHRQQAITAGLKPHQQDDSFKDEF